MKYIILALFLALAGCATGPGSSAASAQVTILDKVPPQGQWLGTISIRVDGEPNDGEMKRALIKLQKIAAGKGANVLVTTKDGMLFDVTAAGDGSTTIYADAYLVPGN